MLDSLPNGREIHKCLSWDCLTPKAYIKNLQTG